MLAAADVSRTACPCQDAASMKRSAKGGVLDGSVTASIAQPAAFTTVRGPGSFSMAAQPSRKPIADVEPIE